MVLGPFLLFLSLACTRCKGCELCPRQASPPPLPSDRPNLQPGARAPGRHTAPGPLRVSETPERPKHGSRGSRPPLDPLFRELFLLFLLFLLFFIFFFFFSLLLSFVERQELSKPHPRESRRTARRRGRVGTIERRCTARHFHHHLLHLLVADGRSKI